MQNVVRFDLMRIMTYFREVMTMFVFGRRWGGVVLDCNNLFRIRMFTSFDIMLFVYRQKRISTSLN